MLLAGLSSAKYTTLTIISGGKDPVIPFPLRDKEAGGVKTNTGLIKIIINLNKIKEEIKTL